MFKFIIKTFDQVKNDNFDQVKFDQVSVSHLEPVNQDKCDYLIDPIIRDPIKLLAGLAYFLFLLLLSNDFR